MKSQDLHQLRGQQENEQDEVLDELINNVRVLKGGQNNIGGELTEQEKLIDVLISGPRLWTTRWTTISIICLRPVVA